MRKRTTVVDRPQERDVPSTAILLSDIAKHIAGDNTPEFFPSIARYVARVFEATHAYVAELTDAETPRIRTLARYVDGALVENIERVLGDDAAAAHVVRDGLCVCRSGARRHFPHDLEIAMAAAESYLGIALFGASGRCLGLIVAMSPQVQTSTRHAEEIATLLSVRAAGVLEAHRTDHGPDSEVLRQAQAALHESQRMFATLVGNLPGMVYHCRNDPDWTMQFISDGCIALTGYRPAELASSEHSYGHIIVEADRRRVWDEVQAALAARLPFQLTYRIRTATGIEKWVWEQGSGIYANDELVCLEGFVTDISERVRADVEMRKLSSAIQQIADSLIITDRRGVMEYVNAAFEQITGYTRAEALGQNASLVKSGSNEPAFYQRLWDTVLAGETFRDVFINRKKNGEMYYEEKTISPLRDAHGEITHFIATGKDITDRMQAQERLHYLAHYDALTDLPNRVLFFDRLNQSLARAHWRRRVVAVLFLDLDRFKYINDTLGHDVGDALLKTLATRLQARVREGDSVARLGGDEFAILLEDIAHAEDVSKLAAKLLDAFTQPFSIASHELYVTGSIGISLYPSDGTTAAALLKNADVAMYRAKDVGKNNYQFYSVDMSTAAFERLTLETSLRHALERDEFLLHYQPQIELGTGRVIGIESLVRWQHPEFGLVGPLQFIGVAEETGAIIPIGEWVLRTAMRQAKQWRDAGHSGLRVSVNVSGRQFSEPGFVDTVARLLKETALAPDAIELEITESVIMENAEKTIQRLRVLHEMGLHFAIDDFGTGYSSLSYLRRFPIHTLKIDKSFIRDITQDSGDAEIVRTIIAMARNLKLSVIAEGLETREQLLFLQMQGCYAAQGYYITRPIPVERMTERLSASNTTPWLLR